MTIYLTLALSLLNFTCVFSGRVLLMLYALKLGAQPFVAGILTALFSALPALLSWQAGRLTDRFGSRWTLMLATAAAACGMLLPYYWPGLPTLYAGAVTNGLLYTFTGVSLQNLIGLQSTPENRALNFSNYSMMVSAGGFLGPLFAGFSIDRFGHAATCLDVLLLAAVPVAMLAIWGGTLPRGSGEAAPAGSIRERLKDPRLWRVLAASSMVITGVTMFAFYMPVYGNHIGLSASAIGVVLSMYAVAAFVVRAILPRLIASSGEDKVLAYAFFLAAAGFFLVPFFRSQPMLLAVSLLFGLGMGVGQPITIMMTFSHSPDGHSAEGLGVRITVVQLTNMIVPVIFGAIGSAFGVFPVFVLSALILAAGGVFSFPGSLSLRRPRR